MLLHYSFRSLELTYINQFQHDKAHVNTQLHTEVSSVLTLDLKNTHVTERAHISTDTHTKSGVTPSLKSGGYYKLGTF